MKTSWDFDGECYFDIDNREFELEFHCEGYYDSGRIRYRDDDYPPEGDEEITLWTLRWIKVIEVNEELLERFYEVDLSDKKTYKRFDKFAGKVLEKCYEECEKKSKENQ
jgi:hypothetical protein